VPLSVSVINQVLVSGTNFALTLFLLRMLPPIEFGIYMIIFAGSVVFTGAGSALLSTQMVVIRGRLPVRRKRPFSATVLVISVAYCALALALGGLLYLAVQLAGLVEPWHQLALACALFAIASYLREFGVVFLYSERRELAVMLVNLALALLLLVLFAVSHRSGHDLTIDVVMWILTAATGASVIVALLLARLPFREIRRQRLWPTMRRLWQGGRFSLLSHMIISLRTQAHTLIATVMLGPVGVAHINAARIFVAPALMVMDALGNVLLPRLADEAGQRGPRDHLLERLVTPFLLGLAGAYLAVIAVFFAPLADLLIDSRYDDLNLLVAVWAVYLLVVAAQDGKDMILMAQRKFSVQAMANFTGALVAIPAALLLALVFAEAGLLVGLVISEIVVLVMIVRHLRGRRPV
jgi:O-antigen/teichoic acid export membrane protein